MDEIPHTRQLPIAQAPPASHPRPAPEFLREHLPGNATAKDEDNAGRSAASPSRTFHTTLTSIRRWLPSARAGPQCRRHLPLLDVARLPASQNTRTGLAPRPRASARGTPFGWFLLLRVNADVRGNVPHRDDPACDPGTAPFLCHEHGFPERHGYGLLEHDGATPRTGRGPERAARRARSQQPIQPALFTDLVDRPWPGRTRGSRSSTGERRPGIQDAARGRPGLLHAVPRPEGGSGDGGGASDARFRELCALREPMAAYGAGKELACAALAGRGEDSARPDGVRIGRRRELRAASRYDAAHAGHARRFHRLVRVRVHVRHAQARLLPDGPDGAGPDSRRRGRLSPRQRRAEGVFRRRGSRYAAARGAGAYGQQVHAANSE